MDQIKLETVYLPHLKTHISSGSLVLFTGAGFSLEAISQSGDTLPSTTRLTQELWDLCFPGDEFEPDTVLQDIYEQALARHAQELRNILHKRFIVDSEASPSWYKEVMAAPWLRAYTLNIDNLMEEVGAQVLTQRNVKCVSAFSDNISMLSDQSLDVIHLNGALADVPDKVTFSRTQYASRIGSDPFYQQLSADLLTRPVVFIGSSLDEGPLWEHVIARGEKGGRSASELRPRSYLVLPKLNKSRQAMLAKYNIVWLPMTGKEFTEQILSETTEHYSAGFTALNNRGSVGNGNNRGINLVSDLAQSDAGQTEYLLGQEPTWSDLIKGKAAERECFNQLWESISKIRASTTLNQFIVLTGTAGSGKSTNLMWSALKLMSAGLVVGWLDSSYKFSRRDFLNALDDTTELGALLINDADIYGGQLSSMVREAIDKFPRLIVIVETRSNKVDQVIKPYELAGLQAEEITMPGMCDTDINKIISVLDAENRLGRLKGMTDIQRINEFKQAANRQLLVAMYETTSGHKFAERAADELADLEGESKLAYALVSAASAYRFSLTRDEVVIACGDSSNETLNSINALVRRKLIYSVVSKGEYLRARHRVIADMVYSHLVQTGQFERVLRGLILIGVAKVSPATDRNARASRLLRTFVNHNFIRRAVDIEVGRNIYAEFEDALSWDSHYWLHRGALELEQDELDLAENFLNQALSINSGDIFIQTEWAYLLFKKALLTPATQAAKDYVSEAISGLETVIIKRQDQSAHAYHILGQQGLNWASTDALSKQEKAEFLAEMLSRIDTAVRMHPRDAHLTGLQQRLKKAALSLAV